MSTVPDQDPIIPEPSNQPETPSAPSFPFPSAERVGDQEPQPEPPDPDQLIPAEPPLFQSWSFPEKLPSPPRIPHLGHLAILILLTSIGLLAAGLLTHTALQFHLFGVSTVTQAETEIHYTLGSMAVLYLATFAACFLVFPVFWHKSLFAGLQWNAATALRRFWLLMAAACACFVLAMVDQLALPGPANAPIDKLFQTSTEAWLLFAFGVTFAPFFEEVFFRGFLLPALCTAWDWTIERITGKPPRPLDHTGQPQWSIFAMILASILTSIPFALMHAEQTGYSLGPFLLLVSVSLVLCWARLATRSLAASVLVHSSYNFILFSFMLLGTSGFRHMDRL